MNDLHEQHAVSDFSGFNARPHNLSALVLQAEGLVKPMPFTDTERLEFIAKHFSGLDFGRGSDPDKQTAYIQPDEEGFFQCLRAPKGDVRFQFVASGKFRDVLDALMKAWK